MAGRCYPERPRFKNGAEERVWKAFRSKLRECDVVGVERAVFDVLEQGRHLTGDLGGKAGTDEFTDAIIDKL